jgi:GT2 family glycosyltransferase
MIKVCFVVVNHNNFSLTADMYQSVVCAARLDFEFDFCVVDNSENDRERDVLIEWSRGCDNINVLFTENKGYFPGLNFGLRFVDQKEYDFVVIGNNDLLLSENFFDVLDGSAFSHDVYAVCPDVLTSDGVHQNPHVVYRYTFFKKLLLDIYFSNFFLGSLLRKAKYLFSKKRLEKDVDAKIIHMGIGAIYILTNRFFECCNGLEYPVFLYGEEAFFSKQVHCNGGVLWYLPELVVHHRESATLSLTSNRRKYDWSRASYRLHRDLL